MWLLIKHSYTCFPHHTAMHLLRFCLQHLSLYDSLHVSVVINLFSCRAIYVPPTRRKNLI